MNDPEDIKRALGKRIVEIDHVGDKFSYYLKLDCGFRLCFQADGEIDVWLDTSHGCDGCDNSGWVYSANMGQEEELLPCLVCNPPSYRKPRPK